MDHAKLLDVLMSLPVSHAILPCAVCFAMSHPANHTIFSYIDSSGYASGPVRCLFIDYIIKQFMAPSTAHSIVTIVTIILIIERNDTTTGTPECIVSDDIPTVGADLAAYDAYRQMVKEVRSNRSAIGIAEKSEGIQLAAGNT